MDTTSKPDSRQIPARSESQSSGDIPPKRISRRRFARDAAAAAAISISPSSLLALTAHNGSAMRPSPSADDNKLNLTPEQKQEVEARLANIIRKYGDRLSEEQRQHLRHILSYNESMLAPIRAFPLKNSDAPATVLKLSTGNTSSASHSGPEDSPKAKHGAPKSEGSAS